MIEQRSNGSRIAVSALLVLLAVVPGHANAQECGRVVAVDDLHGGYDAFVSILRETGLVDEKLDWIGGDACLVQLGDIVDRGARSREILLLLMMLEDEAPGRVHVLLGNHEVLNLIGDQRYAAPGEFASFAGRETVEDRRHGYQSFLQTGDAKRVSRRQRRAEFERSYPRGWFARRREFSPDGQTGAWLLSKPAILKIGRTLFVHGGVSRSDAKLGVKRINERVAWEIERYLQLRDQLIEAGWLSPLEPFDTAFAIVRYRLGQRDSDAAISAVARRFIAMRRASFLRADGPLWDRKLAEADERSYARTVERVLGLLDVDRIVVAHTTVNDIVSRFEGRVFVIDTGIGLYKRGHASALELGAGHVRAVYSDRSETFVIS